MITVMSIPWPYIIHTYSRDAGWRAGTAQPQRSRILPARRTLFSLLYSPKGLSFLELQQGQANQRSVEARQNVAPKP